MSKSKVEYMNYKSHPELPCLVAIRMSSNIPILFGRFKYDGSYYLDGALVDPFPISLVTQNENALGLNIFFSESTLIDTPETGIIDYISKLVQIPIKELSTRKRDTFNSVSVVNLICDKLNTNFSSTKFERYEMFSAGYTQLMNSYKF